MKESKRAGITVTAGSRAARATTTGRAAASESEDRTYIETASSKKGKTSRSLPWAHVDAVIAELKRSKWFPEDIPALETSEAFRLVVAAYCAGMEPAYFRQIHNGRNHEYHANREVCSAKLLVNQVSRLSRLQHPLPGWSGVEEDLRRRLDWAVWEDKRQQLGALLTQAADLFDSGQIPEQYAGDRLALEKGRVSYEKFDARRDVKEWRRRQSQRDMNVDDALWCGTDNLRRWAELIAKAPLDYVFPSAHRPFSLRADIYVGKRGRALNRLSTINGACVRAIARCVPEDMLGRRGNGYKAIADLCGLAGASVTEESARSIWKAELQRAAKK